MRAWERESFEQFWAVARERMSPELLKCLDPSQELYFHLDNAHVALEIYKGLNAVFVGSAIGDGSAWWVHELAVWLKGQGVRRMYGCMETQTWGRVLMARYRKKGIRMEPVEGRPGWGLYEININVALQGEV